jgi:hypothetical protein
VSIKSVARRTEAPSHRGSSQDDVAAGSDARCEGRRQLLERLRQDVRQQDVRGRAVRLVRRGHGQALGNAISRGVLARGEQGLRIDVDGQRARGAELQRGDREHAGPAAVVDHEPVLQLCGVEPFEAQRCRGMRAGPERKAGIELDETRLGDGRIELRTLTAGTDPQSLPEAHRTEVLQPLALPRAIFEVLERRIGERRVQRVAVGRRVEQRLDPHTRPQRRLARSRLQHGIVAGILQRDRGRARSQQSILERRGIGGADGQRQLQERHRAVT